VPGHAFDERSLAADASSMVAAYRAMDAAARDTFFDVLSTDFAATTRYELFERLAVASGGTAALIDMRREVLDGLGRHPAWAAVDADLARLLEGLFTADSLRLTRIDVQTRPAILDQIVRYEAVHPMRNGRELRRRLEADRRCYAFFHPALPDEPIIFAEIALTRGMSRNVNALLDPDSPVVDAASCDCAIFYSISNCHAGLRGVPFGNALIAQTVNALAGELPGLKTFATLSPVPGFRAWLTRLRESREACGTSLTPLLENLEAADWAGNPGRARQLHRQLVPLCAYYLLRVKQGREPADPVARFHLRNGARLERINWLSDTSEAGMRRSAGLMVNYVYGIEDLRNNSAATNIQENVNASRRLERLSRQGSLIVSP
jgi:malonyl-CoA decarboxylase